MNPSDPYRGAYAPLDDAWTRTPIKGWRLPAGPSPPQPQPEPVGPPPLRSNAIKVTQQTLIIGSEAKAILPERLARQYLLIQNGAGSAIYVGFSEIPSVSTGIEILVGGAYEFRDPSCSNQIYVVCPSGTATVRVLEG